MVSKQFIAVIGHNLYVSSDGCGNWRLEFSREDAHLFDNAIDAYRALSKGDWLYLTTARVLKARPPKVNPSYTRIGWKLPGVDNNFIWPDKSQGCTVPVFVLTKDVD